MDNKNAAGSNTESKDLADANPGQQYKGQEGENHSTASEGTLKTPEQLPKFGEGFNESEEQDVDDFMHNKDAQGQATPLNKEDKFTPDDISS